MYNACKHNINLKPVAEVNRWNTKRVKSYMTRIQKHISYLETEKFFYNETELQKKDRESAARMVKLYKKELKRILAQRENVK